MNRGLGMQLQPTDKIIINGELSEIGAAIANQYQKGDAIVATNSSGLLVIPGSEIRLVEDCVNKAHYAFEQLAHADSAAIRKFFALFASRLEDDQVFELIKRANDLDVESAAQRGRSTTRLQLDQSMRKSMIDALHIWRDFDLEDSIDASIEHQGWKVEAHRAPLGIVAFVFEGRPNVFADATGVLTSGNVCIFRIGSDAYETAEAIMKNAVLPSLVEAGLPIGCVTLLPSKSHSSAWALFSHPKIDLAVARGSGSSVSLLGEIAQQQGTPVSLHGTGGAWMIISQTSTHDYLRSVITNSLDRKVCNTLNTIVFVKEYAKSNIAHAVTAISDAAKARSARCVIHFHESITEFFDVESLIPNTEFRPIAIDDLYKEWEWENEPEVSLICVDNISEALGLFNSQSPFFVLSVVSDNADDVEYCWRNSNAPFFCNGFTRWVDGQYALLKPELGLSNWQQGRTLARGGILSGDSMYTVRYRATQVDSSIKR